MLLLPRCCTCCCCRRGQGSSHPLVLLAQAVLDSSRTRRKGATGAAGERMSVRSAVRVYLMLRR